MEAVFFSENINDQAVVTFIYKSVFIDDAFVFSYRVEGTVKMQNSFKRDFIVFLQFKIDDSFLGKIFF